MLKSLRQLALRCLTLSLLAIALTFSNLAFSNLAFCYPLIAQVTSSPEAIASPSTQTKSVEKEQNASPSEDLSIIEPKKDILGKSVAQPKNLSPQDDYDMTAIHKFDLEMYGD